MQKDYWVRLYQEENDSYNELWVTQDNRYFARHTYGEDGVWYHVADPLGYCELENPCGEDVLFHVCDKDFREVFTSSNKAGEGFPCLRVVREPAWRECAGKLPDVITENSPAIFWVHTLTGSSPSHLDNWLLSFKDPELYGNAAMDYEENWCNATEVICEKVLSTFQYAGNDYFVEQVEKRHKICGATWFEYYSANKYMGCKFDQTLSGAMYSPREAKRLLIDALKEIYPDRRYLSRVTVCDGDARETRLNYAQAAEALLKAGCRKSHVDALIQNEREHPSFFTSKEGIMRLYPNFIEDWNYKY